jgi:hypothetical protein
MTDKERDDLKQLAADLREASSAITRLWWSIEERLRNERLKQAA